MNRLANIEDLNCEIFERDICKFCPQILKNKTTQQQQQKNIISSISFNHIQIKYITLQMHKIYLVLR